MNKKLKELTKKSLSQRLIIGAVATLLLLTHAGVYILGSQLWKQATDSSKFSLLNPARAFIAQKDLIVNIQPLRDKLNAIGTKDEKVSIYFEFLNTGANIAVNKDSRYWPASLLKLPVSMAVAHKIERGDWVWGNELVLMTADKDDGFGTLHKNSIGSRFTIEELVRRTLSDSDNTANFMLVRNLEPEEFQNIYDHLGFKDFLSKEGKINAKQYSVMFRSLYNASYLTEQSSQKILQFLEMTPFPEYAGSGIPKNTRFAHKIGVSEEKNVFLDSGIVYADQRPYILTIMIGTKDEVYAKEKMKEISSDVYNYIVNYRNEAL